MPTQLKPFIPLYNNNNNNKPSFYLGQSRKLLTLRAKGTKICK